MVDDPQAKTDNPPDQGDAPLAYARERPTDWPPRVIGPLVACSLNAAVLLTLLGIGLCGLPAQLLAGLDPFVSDFCIGPIAAIASPIVFVLTIRTRHKLVIALGSVQLVLGVVWSIVLIWAFCQLGQL